jgi:polyferredoxin
VGTIILGRFFCGWICPLGTLNHFSSTLKSERKRGARLIQSNRYKKWYGVKYYILVVLLVAALFTSLLIGIFDPISLTVRSIGLSIIPVINYSLRSWLDFLSALPVPYTQTASDFFLKFLKGSILTFKQTYFQTGFWLGIIFIAILAANRWVTRFWCRGVCPLGALLGIISRYSIFGLEKKVESCGVQQMPAALSGGR